MNPEDSIKEQIDERILRLLGLEDLFDIDDYDTYQTLLRETIEKGAFSKNKLSQEELVLLSNERKRVKGKKGRFKPEKITASKILSSNLVKIKKPKSSTIQKSFLTGRGQDDPGALVKVFSSIDQNLNTIAKDLSSQNKFLQDSEKNDRKKREDEKRRKREEGLEKGISKIASVASKILAPVRGILDKIWNFIFYTLLGRAFLKFIDWFNDPKNKDKVDTLKRFLKDWWPSLLGAFVLFATPFGKFVRTFIGTVVKLTARLAKFAIPKLIQFAAKNPLITAGAVTGIAAGSGYMMEQNRMNEIAKKQGTQPEKRGQGSFLNEIGKAFNPGQLGMGGVSTLRNGGIVPTFEGGGTIDESTGLPITGAGEDTQLIAAKPGEIIIPTETVDKYGSAFFMKLIRSSGKSGIPKMVNNIQLAKDGGIVGGVMRGIGRMFRGKPDSIQDMKPSWYGPAPIYDHKTPTVKAILRTIKAAEGTLKSKNPYDVVYGGSSIPVSKMTVKELIDTQLTNMLPKRFGGGRAPWPSGSVASGAYQFKPNTLKQLMTMNVLRPNDKMDADTQDRAAWSLIERRGVNLHQLKSQGLSRGILNTLGREWASLPNLEGKSHYRQTVKSPEYLQGVYNQSLKLGNQPKLKAVTPLNPSSKSSIIQLPDIHQSSGKQVSSSSGTKLPIISSKFTETERINTSIYGIA